MPDYTAANAKLSQYIATYLAIPASQRTARQNAALATDIATLTRQSGGGSTVNTPLQTMVPGSAGPVAMGSPSGSSLAVGLGSVSPGVLVLGGAALLVVLLLRRK